MKCFTNAKERHFEEWAALFAMADPRFKFLGVRTPQGSKASFIEAEWRPLEKKCSVRSDEAQAGSAAQGLTRMPGVGGARTDVMQVTA